MNQRVDVRTVRLTLLERLAPAVWRCTICGAPGTPREAVPCERCALLMHHRCYETVAVTDAERAQLAAAIADNTVEALLDRSIVLCPGCRA